MIPLWIDCDPGIDDAIAILIANKLHAEIVGISAAAGNVPLEHTFDNARKLVEFMNSDVKVYKGANKPMLRDRVTAKAVHGQDGLGGVELPSAKNKIEDKPAFDAIYEAALQYKNELEIVAVGPMTNIALTILKHPDFAKMIKRIIIMGGSTNYGNVTPAAEFNIYADPEAAQTLFLSGIPVVMFALDATMQTYLTENDINEIANLGSKQAEFAGKILRANLNFFYSLGLKGISMHDSCAIMYLFYPELFTLKDAGIYVETQGTITLGKTVTDIYSDKKFENRIHKVAVATKRDEFLNKLKELLSKYTVS